MLQVKRHSLIVEYVVEKGCARVNELSRLFGVSPETIRRDLTALARNKKIVRSFGGAMISENTASFLAEFIINNFKVNKLFFSCQGLDSGLEIKDSNEVNVRLKQEMLKVADQKILMVDSSKFERYSLYKICDLADIDILITNELPGDIYRQHQVHIVETK